MIAQLLPLLVLSLIVGGVQSAENNWRFFIDALPIESSPQVVMSRLSDDFGEEKGRLALVVKNINAQNATPTYDDVEFYRLALRYMKARFPSQLSSRDFRARMASLISDTGKGADWDDERTAIVFLNVFSKLETGTLDSERVQLLGMPIRLTKPTLNDIPSRDDRRIP